MEAILIWWLGEKFTRSIPTAAPPVAHKYTIHNKPAARSRSVAAAPTALSYILRFPRVLIQPVPVFTRPAHGTPNPSPKEVKHLFIVNRGRGNTARDVFGLSQWCAELQGNPRDEILRSQYISTPRESSFFHWALA
jgi:hypothetical protein